MFIKIIIMALTGAVIGWFTNYLAIKLLFRPFSPWKIPFINLSIHGLIPKRRYEIAESISNIIEKQLLTIDEIMALLIQNDNKLLIIDSIQTEIFHAIQHRIPSLVPNSFKNLILHYISDVVNKEVERFIDNSLDDIINAAIEKVNINEIVKDKINSFDLETLELIILSVVSNELKHIELLGGLLGFTIGLLQGIIMIYI